jgi:hypothetical protein
VSTVAISPARLHTRIVLFTSIKTQACGLPLVFP